MAYLRLKDYYAFIQADNLQQVIRNDDSLRIQGENGAQSKITEYLVQKYDLAEEFTDTLVYSPAANYKAGQLVDFNFSLYNASAIYSVNDVALYNGQSYICTTAILTPEAFDPAHWQLVGNQYDLFHIPAPYPEFDYQTNYTKGDVVYYKGRVYQAAQNSVILDQNTALQYSTYSNLPYINSFPGSAYGVQQWGSGVPYSFTGLLPTATPSDFTAWSSITVYTTGARVSFDSKIWQAVANNTNIQPGDDISMWQPISWAEGDNRNPNILEYYITITLYKLHAAIAPINIPALRVKLYDDAIKELDKYADGRITLDLPKLQPIHGNKIRYGGAIKNNNSY